MRLTNPSRRLPAAGALLGLCASAAICCAEAARAPEANDPSRPPQTSAPTHSATVAEPAPAPGSERRRLVRHFDFDERRLGNFDTVPMRWTRHHAWGFPHYLNAGFDDAVGHDAPPSFRLDLDGGSVAYHYRERSIEASPANDYSVSAWVKTRGLTRARAFISACLLDQSGHEIAGTHVFSRKLGGRRNDAWEYLVVRLSGGVREARYVAVSVWLAQPGAVPDGRRGTPASANDIEDIHGSAWFDDIRVHCLPYVHLASDAPGNVFDESTPPTLTVLVSDPEGSEIDARLVVRGADGVTRLERRLPVKRQDPPEPDRLVLPEWGPGLYRAELTIAAEASILASQTLDFARMCPRRDSERKPGAGFGVAVTTVAPARLMDQASLIERLGAEWVKVPVWHPPPPRAPGVTGAYPHLETYLARLAKRGHQLVGWIGPDRPASEGRADDATLIGFLSAPASAWQPRLAYPWSVYGALVGHWQIGDEADAQTTADPRLAAVVAEVGRQMRGLISKPRLAMPADVTRPPAVTTRPSDDPPILAWNVGSEIPTDALGAYLPTGAGDPQRDWLTIEAPPTDRYGRLERIADLTRRVVLAYAGRPGAVFLCQPWSVEESGEARVTEDYVVFRTIADRLGGTLGIGRVELDGRAECQAFDRDGQAVLALWDGYAPPEGVTHWLPLSHGATQTDPWGRTTRLEPVDGQCPVRVGPMPTFVEPMPTLLVRLRQSFKIDSPQVESSVGHHERILAFTNPLRSPISGTVRITAPPGWDVRPGQIHFSLPPQGTHREQLTLTFPLHSPAGSKAILCEVEVDADRRYRCRAPVWLELGLRGIDVETFTQRSADALVVRQAVTNRTAATVSFHCSLAAAHREPLTRLIANLPPGQTATKEFELQNAAQLSGRLLRLSLREVNGPRVWNKLIPAP